MAEPKKILGAGSKCLVSADGLTYTALGSVTSVGTPELKRDSIDVTDLNSYEANEQMKQSLPGYLEAGDLTLEGLTLAEDAGMEIAETAFNAPSLLYVQIVFPTPMTKALFVEGYVTALKSIGDVNTTDAIKYNLTVHPEAKPKMDSAKLPA